MIDQERISSIRSLFTDDLSKRIFDIRMAVSVDRSKLSFPDTMQLVSMDEQQTARLEKFVEAMRDPAREKFIYGAGVGCESILERENVRALGMSGEWTGIIDNHVTEPRYGLPVIPFDEFVKNHSNALVLNSVGQPAGASIHKQCVEAGLTCVSLFELDQTWNQYFDLPKELGLVGNDEVFVQAGCYNGDTQKSYINWFGDTYAKLITFEPSEEQFAISKERLAGLRDVEIVKAGLSAHSGVVRFDLDIPGRSFISESGSEEIRVVAMDEYLQGTNVTFIALDIEGEELAALRGAKQIIQTQKPKLAISIYHKPEDMWEIPELIRAYHPTYQFYLRHYHLLDTAETVLYAL